MTSELPDPLIVEMHDPEQPFGGVLVTTGLQTIIIEFGSQEPVVTVTVEQ